MISAARSRRYLFLALFVGLLVFHSLATEQNADESAEDISSEETVAESEQQNIILEDIDYKTPQLDDDNYLLYESFDDSEQFTKKWIKSQTTKAESDEYKYEGEWSLVESNKRLKGDLSLVMQSKARHHAIGSKLDKKFEFNGQKLVVQYEVQFKNGQECGGAYIKLLSSPSGDLNQLNDKTAYSVMFGPDKCGNDYKLHFIFMHKNPRNGTLREIHWKKSTAVNKLDEAVKDGKWHVFRLVISPDSSYEIEMDRRTVGKGSLNEDFNPSVNPPKEIDDPNDSKPEDWDEREKVPDPEAVKPDDWDENEPRKISDPN
ncbi:calnexin-like protein, partial [Leptotrombidium deliense]